MKALKTLLPNWNDLIGELWLKGRSVAIGIFDTEGRLLSANPALCFYLNAEPSDLQPKNFFVNPEFTTFVQNSTSELVFEGFMTLGNRRDISYVLQAKVFRRRDNILVFAEVDAPSLIQENTKMSQLNQLVNNLQRQLIKEKKTLQDTLQELKETQQMLIHSEKMNAMGKLVAGVAHELNNPISFVYSNLFSLEKDIADVFDAYSEIEKLIIDSDHAPLNEAVASIRVKNNLDFLREDITDMTKESKIGIERVKTIVEDLRTFSRLDEAEIKQVGLLETIRSTLTIVRPELTKKEIQFFQSVPDIELECYPGQLNQALLNVLINAIQAVDTGGNIWLTVIDKDSQIELSIKDDGCGIPEELQSRIFEPFFTTKPIGSGTGLGLSITYKIIHDLHHGSIEVVSEPGIGSTFLLILPKKVLV